MVDDRDPIGEAIRLVQVLSRQQHGRALGDAGLDHLPEAEPAARVEPGGRLVEEEHRRARDERRREIQAAAHAAGVGAHQAIAGLVEVEAVEQLACPLLSGIAAQVVEPADHLEVLEPGQPLVDRRVLAGEADLRAQLGRVLDHVEAGDARAPRAGREQRGQDPDRGRLPGAVGAEQPEHGPLLDLEVDPAERLDVAVGLLQALDLDCRVGRGQVDQLIYPSASISMRIRERVHRQLE